MVGPIRRRQPVQARDVAFLRANTDRPIKITIPGPFTMTQQLHDEHYRDEAALTFDCAAALNEEIKDLFAAGADVVQLDEPFLQARPEEARRFGVPAIDRAVDGVGGTTALHLCFGYAARVKEKPSGYSFLPELAASKVDQISIEAAEPKLDCAILARLPDKQIILGVLDLGAMAVETPATRRRAHPPRARLRGAGAADRGAGLRAQISAARGGVRQAAGDGRRRGHRPPRAGGIAIGLTRRLRGQNRPPKRNEWPPLRQAILPTLRRIPSNGSRLSAAFPIAAPRRDRRRRAGS